MRVTAVPASGDPTDGPVPVRGRSKDAVHRGSAAHVAGDLGGVNRAGDAAG